MITTRTAFACLRNAKSSMSRSRRDAENLRVVHGTTEDADTPDWAMGGDDGQTQAVLN